MKVLQIGVAGTVLILLASCSTLGADGKLIDYGATAKQVPPLDVPPDLTVPGIDDRYKIPQGDIGAVATFSDYSKSGSPQENITRTVLPDVQGVRLEREGTQHWLVVDQDADDVWPVVREFWTDLGLTILSEDKAAGVMETDWAENRARITKETVLGMTGEVFESAYIAGAKDQYLTRFERSDEKRMSGHPKDGKSTEVHITHRGVVRVFSSDMTLSKWLPRASDTELEAVLLQRLMVRFGASETRAVIAAAAITPVAAVSAVPGVEAISTTEPAGTASLREISDGNVVMVMNDPFDRSWRKVGLAIEGSGLAIEDKDRDKGVYYLRQVKIEKGWWERMKFWKSDPEKKKHYRVIVKDGGTACVVSVTDQDGAGSPVTKQMIETLYKNINK